MKLIEFGSKGKVGDKLFVSSYTRQTIAYITQ